MEQCANAARATAAAKEAFLLALESKCGLLSRARDVIAQEYEDLKREKDKGLAKHGNTDSSEDDLLEINAGGEVVAVKRGTLTQLGGTKLETLFAGRWEKELQRDRLGRIFLDVNPTCFRNIVDYLNELRIFPPGSPPGMLHVDKDDEEFMNRLLAVLEMDGFWSSRILNAEQGGILHGFLAEDDVDGKTRLLYRGSRDGFEPCIFHSRCDDKGATVTVIRSDQGHVFGGYTDVSWTSKFEWKKSPNVFLFELDSCGRAKTIRKMSYKGAGLERCIYCSPHFGPNFGKQMFKCLSLRIRDQYCETETRGVYHCPTGQDATAFISGQRKLKMNDIEVFAVDGPDWTVAPKKRKRESSNEDSALEEWLEVDFDGFPSDVKNALEEEQRALAAAYNKVSKQQRALREEKEFIDFFAKGHVDDIIQLNVSGKRIDVRRSTLGMIEDSALAKQFNDPLWAKTQSCSSELVNGWTCEQVEKWISEIKGIPEITSKVFVENDITGVELLAMERDDLKDLGITRPGTLAILNKAIGELRRHNDNDVTLVEHSAYCFGKIIDHLRLLSLRMPDDPLPPPPQIRKSDKHRFERTVDFYFPGNTSAFLGCKKRSDCANSTCSSSTSDSSSSDSSVSSSSSSSSSSYDSRNSESSS